MAVFENCSVFFELKNVPLKEKKKLTSIVTDNGGAVCLVLNDKCSLVVTNDVSSLSRRRLRDVLRLGTPVVAVDYLTRCVEGGALLPVGDFQLETPPPEAPPPPPASRPHTYTLQENSTMVPPEETSDLRTDRKSDPPAFPDHFQVAKYSVFQKGDGDACCVLELQSSRVETGRRYRLVRVWRDQQRSKDVGREVWFPSSSEDALAEYQDQRQSLKASGFQERTGLPDLVQDQDLVSPVLQQLLVEDKLLTEAVSQKDVALLVELVWAEALGGLDQVLEGTVDQLSLSDVSRAEGLLLQARKKLQEEDEDEEEHKVASLLQEFYALLPHKTPPPSDPDLQLVSDKLDLCQLIRDILNVSEATLRSSAPSCVGKYRALRCSLDLLTPGSSEYQLVANLVLDRRVSVQQVFRVSRLGELQKFQRKLGNIQTLLHSSDPKNLVGILSRGLLLPRELEEVHGTTRRDAGLLGSGIYFGNSVKSALFYSKPCQSDGSHLLLVCNVALGTSHHVFDADPTLTAAPDGYHSVYGQSVRRRSRTDPPGFKFDELVVYNPDQVQLMYVIKYADAQNPLKDFNPAIDMTAEPSRPPTDPGLSEADGGLEDMVAPLQHVQSGLLDSSGRLLPLQAVHVKCRLMDLLSQVTIFQKYSNQSAAPIEAKYVFPLDDSAAVCGFEAFINGKHVVGQVKEKEVARQEYREAVARGHGAYLMDQDAPDVFTISVGNLPAGATVLIKVTFVSELIVKDSSVVFSLPGSVAPWQQSAALNQTTQLTVKKVSVTDQSGSSRDFTLDMSVDMPFQISSLQCTTHQIKTKRTDCKAVVSVLPGSVLGPDGFQLLVTLSEVHLPRMWVENHPDKDSQACMLVFYPRFEVSARAEEVVLLLDTSESMQGECLTTARRIALQVLKNLDSSVRLNVVLFGTDHKEAFLTARPVATVRQEAERFIKRGPPVGGSTELWRPLRALSLLPPSGGIRNLLLVSDGHIQNADAALQLLRDNVQHSRLFTCGLSSTANRYMLRALARAGGGAYEFFDKKTKHNWLEKVERQVKRMASPGCSSVSVKWQQFDPDAAPPLQAPRQLHGLFNDCHTLVYGFVPHCSQATLLGNLSGRELETMVSTSTLQKTTGTFLHKLTARAMIRDFEDGNLEEEEGLHESRRAELRSVMVALSREFSILSQLTSFVAVEERESELVHTALPDVPQLLAEEDVDFLPYISWTLPAKKTRRSLGLRACKALEEEVEEVEEEEGEEEVLGAEPAARPTKSRSPSPLEQEELRHVDLEDVIFDLMGPDSDSDSSSFSSAPAVRSSFCSLFSAEMKEELPAEHELKRSKGFKEKPRKMFKTTVSASFAPPAAPPAAAPPAAAPSFRRRRDAAAPSFRRRGDVGMVGTFFANAPPAPPPPGPGLAPPPPPPPPFRRWAARSRSLMGHVLEAECQSLSHFTAPPPPGLAPPPPPPGPGLAPPPPPPSFSRRTARSQSQRRHVLQDVCQSLSLFTAPPPPGLAPPPPPPFRHMAVCCQSAIVRPSAPPSPPASPAPPAPPAPSAPPAPPAAPAPPALGSALGFGASADSVQPLNLMRRSKQHQVPLRAGGGVYGAGGGVYGAGPEGAGEGGSAGLSGYQDLSRMDSRSWIRSLVEVQLCSVVPEAPAILVQEYSLPLRTRSKTKTSKDVHHLRHRTRWTNVFQLQDSEGFWDFTPELEELIGFRASSFTEDFLVKKGIVSLGARAHADILRLLATLLVLQMLRVEQQEEGKLLRTLFCLEESSGRRPEFWEAVKRAVAWARWADRQYPCIYSRLEFGYSWEAATRQLLGYDTIPPASFLQCLDLQRVPGPLLVR